MIGAVQTIGDTPALGTFRHHAKRLAVIAISLSALLTGCVTFSPDGGMSRVAETIRHEINKDVIAIRTPDDAAAARAASERWLRRALTADSAVQIALLNNRALQAAYNELALAEAEMVGESLPPNPGFSLSRISSTVEVEIEKRIVADILALATLPARAEIAATRFRRAQLQAIVETLRVAAQARRAYYRAVATRELANFLAQSQTAAEAATKLAVRLGETGAMNKLDQARDQVFYAELTAQLATARQRASSDREALTRAMGVWGADIDFRLPNTLPSPPARAQAMAWIEAEAVRRRYDLQMARLELEALTKAYGLTQVARFINILDAGYASKTTKEKATGERVRDRGYEVEFVVPIFDFGEVRVREAEAIYMQAVNRLLQLSVNARSEARDAYRTYRSTHEIAAHYRREILPLRKIISDESLLRYNAMLIDVFALLAEARQRIAANVAAIEAQRDFWLATTDLSTAILGGGLTSVSPESSRPMTGATAEAAGH